MMDVQPKRKNIIALIRRDWLLLLIALPPIAYFILFHYVPMYGVLIAFKDFRPLDGILGSPWVGLKHFEQFFNSVYFGRLLRNTVLLSVFSLLWSFSIPILFALLLNELRNQLFKRVVQTASYLPHFISVAVVVGMMVNFLSPVDGIVNQLLMALGMQPIHFLSEPGWFRTIFISSGIWQSFGWESIIYIAAIAGINPHLYEAAEMDGAKRFQKMMYITIPGILPTIIILFILNIGNLMSVSFEKVLLLYSPAIYETADVIGTFVYRRGIQNGEFSYGTAISLFNNVINIILLLIANYTSRKVSQTSLW